MKPAGMWPGQYQEQGESYYWAIRWRHLDIRLTSSVQQNHKRSFTYVKWKLDMELTGVFMLEDVDTHKY